MSNAIAATPKFDVANIDALVNQIESTAGDLTSGGTQSQVQERRWSLAGTKIRSGECLQAVPNLPKSSSTGCAGRTAR